jgi:hypothetical protein
MADRLGRLTTQVLVAMTLALIASSGAFAGPATAGALEALDACLEKLNPEIDMGYERIAVRCPQLAHRLEESGWSPWLPRDWKRTGNDLSAGGLRELREILARDSIVRHKTEERVHRPGVASLPAVLADLTTANSTQVGWWVRTREWLRDVFESREPDEAAGWLGSLVGDKGLSQTVLELTSFVALMLVALLAVVIVIHELRVGGVSSRLWNGLARGRRPSAAPESGSRELIWDDVLATPLMLRPQLLLEVLIARLTAARHLPPARALTVREVIRAARLADEADLERLSQLARITERVRFASAPVESAELVAAVEHSRGLFERLAEAAAAPEAGGRS